MYVTLSNCVEMSQLGYGVYQVTADERERCVRDALEVGYRHIDTTQSHFNEEQVGAAIEGSGVSRSELFLTTKVWTIDVGRVFFGGYSGGGETLSRVMGIQPDLFPRALFCSLQWDGDLEVLAASRVPVYLVIGESDEYYGPARAEQAAAQLADIYRR